MKKWHWWFESEYGKAFVNIEDDTLVIKNRGVVTFGLHKKRDVKIKISYIKEIIIQKPKLFQSGYLYFVLTDEIPETEQTKIVLLNNSVNIKWKDELVYAGEIKAAIEGKNQGA
ncbi:hypothetical protein [Spiroplasma eriocheiris]|uniref:Uncharacterized protein n=1 Tax=Spiroplasma eriocheiris TaxID=315358 RepID=A0A0H3XNE1_9MOLU|nr:hypothetical protein [Spiroplasma eriocheiris]AHF58297.1 hypothetical protein SPE_1185 [Spiroplasma eriocheiris CCTCC M 207170]AKM54732.1 hypothetical protein SERIO_v1c11830 [Spiroplasma eriocheiris]